MEEYNYKNTAKHPPHMMHQVTIIPNGTIAKVQMLIKPGNHNDYSKGITGNYACKSIINESIYLNVEFIVITGEFLGYKIEGLICLDSVECSQLSKDGYYFIQSIFKSAHGISSCYISEKTFEIKNLDGIEFIARIDEVRGIKDNVVNEIKSAIQIEHQSYDSLMNSTSTNL